MPDTATPDERWLPVQRHAPRYEVSDRGGMRSVPRKERDSLGRVRSYRGRVLNPWSDGNGYLMVALCGGRRETRTVIGVHILVMETFGEPKPSPDMEVLHRDGNPANNDLSNLEWGTSSQNKRDIIRHGRNYWLNRDRCDYGHELAGPNLDLQDAGGRIRRRCVACKRATGILAYLRRTGRDGDFRTIADQKYAEVMAGSNAWETRAALKVACRRDHLLIEPNLVRYGTGRVCLTCHRTHALANYAKRKGRPFDFDAVAAAKYAEIMKDVPQRVLDDARRPGPTPNIEVPAYTRAPSQRRAKRRAATRPAPVLDLPGEKWRPVVGWKDTRAVSNLGRLRSLGYTRTYSDGRVRVYPPRLLKLTESRGYLVVGLPLGGGQWRTKYVHNLVARAFLGKRPEGLEVLHNDGNGLNARLDNLRYGTHAENAADMVRHGRTARERQGDTCPWGHELIAPNLMEWKLPARSCLACSRTAVAKTRARERGEAFDHQAVSDQKYREIMGWAEKPAPQRDTHCGRGHPLIPINLVPSRDTPACLACNRARSLARHHARRGVVLDLQELSDRKFAEIVGVAAA